MGVFGSFASGLYLHSSDIDLIIEDSRKQKRQLLQEVVEIFRFQAKGIEILDMFPYIRVPIIKCRDKATNIQVDLVFNEYRGLAQIHYFQEACECYPEFKYLYIFFKFFLKQRGFNNTYTGGVGELIIYVWFTNKSPIL